MTVPSEPPNPPYHHGDLRSALIATAERWMKERADWGFTLREIAREVGVSHNAPYRHFADKAALLAALGERGFGRLAARLAAAVSQLDQGDAPARLEMAAVAYVGFAKDEPAVFRLMFGEDLAACAEPKFRKAADGAFGAVNDIVARGVAAGRFRSDPDQTHAEAAWALAHGLGLLMIDGRLAAGADAVAAEDRVRGIARTLIEGLNPD